MNDGESSTSRSLSLIKKHKQTMAFCLLKPKTFFLVLIMVVSTVQSLISPPSSYLHRQQLFPRINNYESTTDTANIFKKKSAPTFIKSLINEDDEPVLDKLDDLDGGDQFDEMPAPADFPVVAGTVIFIYSIYFIYLALFTDEVLDPRVPLAL
jgi:hypothetical protein